MKVPIPGAYPLRIKLSCGGDGLARYEIVDGAASLAVAPWAAGNKPPRLLDQVRSRIRRLGLDRRTEDAHVGWIRRFMLANGKGHPREPGAPHVAEQGAEQNRGRTSTALRKRLF